MCTGGRPRIHVPRAHICEVSFYASCLKHFKNKNCLQLTCYIWSMAVFEIISQTSEMNKQESLLRQVDSGMRVLEPSREKYWEYNGS
jgi:hypothetical protein